jgi:propane monooxygenase small subunit
MSGEHDYDRDVAYTRNLFRILTRDEEFGESNKALLSTWLSTWVPRCLDAAHALQPLWSQPAEKTVTFASSLGAAEDKFTSLLESIELETPEELMK